MRKVLPTYCGERLEQLEPKRALLERYHKSCETQRTFCELERIPISTLQNWLKRERGRARFTEVAPTKGASTTIEWRFPDGTALGIRSE